MHCDFNQRLQTAELNVRPIYMVMLASAVEGSFDVKSAQCN